ncbi:putative Ig domain-containing protein [Aliivibrio fischeri]|uniref:putative Ig domain-containing protein n=1 Tax=Aliivibrio fischeri TaxID=668 RepID=UPI0007C5509A|nr:putative Ig domain-containing protein [Aliivibrio fischeri]
MKKVSLLAASVALALVGCGGSDGGSDTNTGTPSAGGIIITAIDGYLHNAEIWVDKDGNLANGCELNTEIVTNKDGKATISKTDFAGMNVCIKAIAGKTIDTDRGLVAKGFDLASPASESNNIIVNPMTNMVVEQMANNNELTPETAKDEVVKAITGTGLKADADMIFGDYLANPSDEAKALKVIGETLVDNNDKSVETQLTISTEVANDTNEIINNSGELDNYAPVVEVTPDGGVTVKPNSRPVVDLTPEAVTMLLGDVWVAIDASELFSDADGDTLTYSMQTLGSDNNGLVIDETTGLITGTPKAAGEFIYQVFAEDTKGSLSYPANLKVTIETPNTAPTHSPEALETIQAKLNALTLTQGDKVNETIAATGLFTDVDGDALKYTVENVPAGMSVTLDSDELSLTGTPSNHGEFTVGLFANDGVNQASAEAEVTLTIEEAAVTPSHPLEGKFLHFVEIGNNGTEFAKAWCDSIYLDADSKTMYWNSRDNGNLSTCDTNMSEFTEGVPYAIVGDKIVSQEDGMKMTLDVIKQHSFDDDKHFLVSFTDEEGNDKSTELYSYHTNAQYVEEALNNDVSESQANPNWVDRETFIAMPSAEGTNDTVVTELKVSGIVQQFDYQGSPYSSASIYGRNAETCAILKDIYLDYGSIRVHGDNYGANNYFNSQPQYRDVEGSCYIDLMPFEPSVAIPSGLYTIEAKPERTDEAERIVFSFKK